MSGRAERLRDKEAAVHPASPNAPAKASDRTQRIPLPHSSTSKGRRTATSKNHTAMKTALGATSTAPARTSSKITDKRPPFRSSLASATRPTPIAEPIPCPECRTSSAWFLCQNCVQAKLEKHKVNMTRLMASRDGARRMTEALLGPDPSALEVDGANIPDPFGPPSDLPRNPHPLASHRGRASRSRWSHSSLELAQREADLVTHGQQVDSLRESVMTKRAELNRRREYLKEAQRMLSPDAEIFEPGGYRRGLEINIQQLRRKVQVQNDELSRARKVRQQQLLEYYFVTPPSGNMQHVLVPPRERYMPGAFEAVQHPSQTTTTPTYTSSEWTILPSISPLALPLPTGSDIKRYARVDVNTAATLTCQLLQAMATICGVALPFKMTLDENGRWCFTPDELWTASGIPTTSTRLHLGQSAFAAISGTPSSPSSAIHTAGRGIEASMMSLGASTLSTLESFVTLPGRNNKAWGRASALQAQADHGKEATVPESKSNPGPSRKSDTALSAVRDFCRALIMLAYNAAYFAWSQGVQIDLVKAGGSTLRLLYEAAYAVGTKRSHLAVPPSSNALQDFTFPALDFPKLLQLHELHHGLSIPQGNNPGPTSTTSLPTSRRIPSTSLSRQTMEDSYVDAGQAAASLMDLKSSPTVVKSPNSSSQSKRSPTTSPIPPSARLSAAPPDRRTAGTTSRRATSSRAGSGLDTASGSQDSARPSRAAPLSLEFLRQRGKKVARDGDIGSLAKVETHGSAQAGPSRLSDPDTSVKNGTGSSASPSTDKEGKTKYPISAEEGEGRRAGKLTTSDAASAGTVIFNGKEVGVGGSKSGGTRRRAREGGTVAYEVPIRSGTQTSRSLVPEQKTAIDAANNQKGSNDRPTAGWYLGLSRKVSSTSTTSVTRDDIASRPRDSSINDDDKGQGKGTIVDETEEWDVV